MLSKYLVRFSCVIRDSGRPDITVGNTIEIVETDYVTLNIPYLENYIQIRHLDYHHIEIKDVQHLVSNQK